MDAGMPAQIDAFEGNARERHGSLENRISGPGNGEHAPVMDGIARAMQHLCAAAFNRGGGKVDRVSIVAFRKVGNELENGVYRRGGFAARMRGPCMSALQIAIDGPAAGGKTTVAQLVARRLDLNFLDTGAMYRALAFLALHHGTEADNAQALRRLCEDDGIRVEFERKSPHGFRIFAGERELVEETLHSPDVTAIVSTVAAHAAVRDAMVTKQRAIADDLPVVMAGRDIGTIVLPDAPVKILLTASIAARAQRRRAQLAAAGIDAPLARLTEEIEERDRLDRSRPVAPLVPARGAHVIDSSDMSVDDVVNAIAAIALRSAA
jgi:cytidylate kinase